MLEEQSGIWGGGGTGGVCGWHAPSSWHWHTVAVGPAVGARREVGGLQRHAWQPCWAACWPKLQRPWWRSQALPSRRHRPVPAGPPHPPHLATMG